MQISYVYNNATNVKIVPSQYTTYV